MHTVMSRIQRISFLELVGMVTASIIITFILFVIMQKLVAQKGGYAVEEKPFVMINPIFDLKQQTITPKPKIKPLPPPTKMPEAIQALPKETPNDNTIAANFNPRPVDNQIAKADRLISLEEGSARPIFRMAPKYPQQAAMDGVEGWVQLEFSIDASGAVTNVKVTDSQPRRLFDKEAIRALKKWKYKPMMIDGRPTVQDGLQIVLDFNLQG